jgi:hypothetical protein
MNVGFIMLVHEALSRVEDVARHLSRHRCPVVIHVDKRVELAEYDALVDNLADLPDVIFSNRYACEWGMWPLVQAALDASELMLKSFEQVQHVYLSSGSCLPLRPIADLNAYLAARPETDFIESVTTKDVPWAVGGLEVERFTLRFPFSWKRQRKLFDAYVKLQRRLKFSRKIPDGLVPHLGSQWWCLSRSTLSAILTDPNREIYDAYFKKSWIPDESYFQTLARRHSTKVESRSLTLSKFGYGGRPHTFYDDHLQLLRRSDCFVARKIWSKADMLYDAFLNDAVNPMKGAEPDPGKIDRLFSKAVTRRVYGREGLHMQSRHPTSEELRHKTCAGYSVFSGYSDLFENFDEWLQGAVGAHLHGHIFGPKRAEFVNGQSIFAGAISDHAELRDHNPAGFLSNLIWNTRGERQCFMIGPEDNIDASWSMARDPNADISIISGAWAVRLFLMSEGVSDIIREAARLQKLEAKHLKILQSPEVKATVRVWTTTECLENPLEPVLAATHGFDGVEEKVLETMPKLRRIDGFEQFLQNLKNQGMHPHLVGEFSVPNATGQRTIKQNTRYVAR